MLGAKVNILTVILCACFICNVSLCFSEEETLLESGKLKNGTLFQLDNQISEAWQAGYIAGLREAVGYFGAAIVEENYYGYSDRKVSEEIRRYYKSNPDKIKRPVIEVMLAAGSDADTFNVMTPRMETDEYLNGYYLLSKEMDPLAQMMYVQGLCDATAKLDMQTMLKFYAYMQHPDIFASIIKYYLTHPSKREQPIIDVLISGSDGVK